MSVNPIFSTPNWLPTLFFGLAAVVVVWLVVHLILSWSGERKLREHRNKIATRLSEFYLAGEEIKRKFRENDFNGDAIAIVTEWSQSVKKYFLENPKELGTARLISLHPRQFDWFVYGHFNPFGNKERDKKYLAFQNISIEMEKLTDLIEEFYG